MKFWRRKRNWKNSGKNIGRMISNRHNPTTIKHHPARPITGRTARMFSARNIRGPCRSRQKALTIFSLYAAFGNFDGVAEVFVHTKQPCVWGYYMRTLVLYAISIKFHISPKWAFCSRMVSSIMACYLTLVG